MLPATRSMSFRFYVMTQLMLGIHLLRPRDEFGKVNKLNKQNVRVI